MILKRGRKKCTKSVGFEEIIIIILFRRDCSFRLDKQFVDEWRGMDEAFFTH